MLFRFLRLWVLLLIVVPATFLPSGCRLASDAVPPQRTQLESVGIGKAPTEAEWAALLGLGEKKAPEQEPEPGVAPRLMAGPDFPAWSQRIFTLQTQSAISDTANSHVEAVMLARQTARDQLLREMARYVGELAAPSGGTLKDLLLANTDRIAEVEQVIRAHTQFEGGGEVSPGRYLLGARLELRPVALTLFGIPESAEDRQGGKRGKARIEPEKLQRMAMEKAMEDGRGKLQEQVGALLLGRDYTVAEHLDNTPEARRIVRAAVENASVQRRLWDAQTGTSEITLTLDAAPILDRLREGMRFR